MPTFLTSVIAWEAADAAAQKLLSAVKHQAYSPLEHILCEKASLRVSAEEIEAMGLQLKGYSLEWASVQPFQNNQKLREDFQELLVRADGGGRAIIDLWIDDVPAMKRHIKGDRVRYDFIRESPSVSWYLLQKQRGLDELGQLHQQIATALLGTGRATVMDSGISFDFGSRKYGLTSQEGGHVEWKVGIPGSVDISVPDISPSDMVSRCLSVASLLTHEEPRAYVLHADDGLSFGSTRPPLAVSETYSAARKFESRGYDLRYAVFRLVIISVIGARKAVELEPEQARYFPLYQFKVDGSDEACQFAIVVGRKKPRIEIEAPKGVAKEQLEQLLGLPLTKG